MFLAHDSGSLHRSEGHREGRHADDVGAGGRGCTELGPKKCGRASHRLAGVGGLGLELRDAATGELELPENKARQKVDEALQKLEEIDSRKAELVRLRFFAGLTLTEAAKALGISASTADNDWAYAKTWLKVEMAEAP